MSETEVITSRDNSKLKLARAVRDGREAGLIFVEGVRLVREAVRSALTFEVVLTSTDLDLAEAVPEIERAVRVTQQLLDSVADTENSQGIIAIAHRPDFSLEDIRQGLVVLLHRANNPSNLGAVVRTAEAAGVAGLITTTGSADAFSPKALRASMGSAFRLPVVERMELEAAIEWAKDCGLEPTAADVSGESSYTEVDWTTPRLLIFGSEAHGLEGRELDLIDEKILIPMENEVESLNLAVSSGIVLFEAKRQRDARFT